MWERMIEKRKELGLSQKQLAANLGVAQSTVAGWESGTRAPDFTRLRALASELHTTINYLLDWDNKEPLYGEDTDCEEVESDYDKQLHLSQYLSGHPLLLLLLNEKGITITPGKNNETVIRHDSPPRYGRREHISMTMETRLMCCSLEELWTKIEETLSDHCKQYYNFQLNKDEEPE